MKKGAVLSSVKAVFIVLNNALTSVRNFSIGAILACVSFMASAAPYMYVNDTSANCGAIYIMGQSTSHLILFVGSWYSSALSLGFISKDELDTHFSYDLSQMIVTPFKLALAGLSGYLVWHGVNLFYRFAVAPPNLKAIGCSI